jgi:hypothetical protein
MMNSNDWGLTEANGASGMFKVSPYKMSKPNALTLILEIVELRKMVTGA